MPSENPNYNLQPVQIPSGPANFSGSSANEVTTVPSNGLFSTTSGANGMVSINGRSALYGAAKNQRPGNVGTNGGIKGQLDKSDIDENFLFFSVPDWNYSDFIRERTMWQKGLDSSTGEPGWFYFKVFFRFDTPAGLFGGLLKEENLTGDQTFAFNATDSAKHYLEINQEHYAYGNTGERLHSLKRFAAILAYINGNAPWFFDSITGLDKASSPNILNPLSPENIIELGFKEDAVDMRVTTLLDLYKYAVYDYVNMKEVVPENLRLFDMCIVLFHTPLRWYHTGMKTMRRGSFNYKGLSNDNPDDRMSYKMYTFKGCELVRESLGNVWPGEISNNEPFNLAKARIQIHYKRVYQHTFNEWGRFMIGDDGIYYDATLNGGTGTPKRLAAIQDAKDNPFYFNRGADIFKPLVDVTEEKITWAMRKADPSFVFGNLYLDKTDTKGSYYQEKLREEKHGSDSLHRNGPVVTAERTERDNSGFASRISRETMSTISGGSNNWMRV